MRKIAKYGYLFLLIASVLASGCRRSLEEDMGDTALIPFHIDWSQSMLNPIDMQHASVWVFPKDGRKPYEHIMETNKVDGILTLPVGKYSLIVFNERVGTSEDSDTWPLAFYGTDKYETFQVGTKDDNNPWAKLYYNRTIVPAPPTTMPIRLPPNIISSWNLDEFEVTNEMVIVTRTRANISINKSPAAYGVSAPQEQQVDNQLKRLLEILPKPLIKTVTIEVYVQNLFYANLAQGRLKGASSGMMVAKRTPVTGTVSHAFKLYTRGNGSSNPAIWDPANPENGWVSTRFHIFEHQNVLDYYLDLDFTLTDGTKAPPISEEVTSKVDKEVIIIEIKVGQNPSMPDPDPEKPETPIILPRPVGGDVGVGEWDEVTIPLV